MILSDHLKPFVCLFFKDHTSTENYINANVWRRLHIVTRSTINSMMNLLKITINYLHHQLKRKEETPFAYIIMLCVNWYYFFLFHSTLKKFIHSITNKLRYHHNFNIHFPSSCKLDRIRWRGLSMIGCLLITIITSF